jgi:hypothetical protein
MDDLIVIILTLVIAGVGALAQLKKKRNQQSNSGQSEKSADFWDLLEDNTEPASQDVGYVNDEEMQMESVVTEEVSSNKLRTKNNDQSFRSKKVVKEMRKPRSKLNGEFSLRKAVIYSEILNRKYT